MPRRARVNRKQLAPDAKYHNMNVARLINRLMLDGKKSKAERIVYEALDILEKQQSRDAVSILEQAIKNITPLLEVKARRVGGATYQVPIEVRADRGLSLALRWLTKSTRARTGKPMSERLAAELGEASKGQGVTVKKREDTHKMAEANKAFAHYRW